MESQNGSSGGEGIENAARESEVVVGIKRHIMRQGVVVLRVCALAFILTGAVVLGVDKETKTVAVMVGATLPPVHLQVTTESHYVASFVFFVVANSVASGYIAMSLLLILANKINGKKVITLIITLADAVMAALVFTGVGAAGTIGLLGYKGNRHVQWNKVCTVFQKFCGQAFAAIAVSAIGGTMLLLLVLLAIFNLYKEQERHD